MKHVLIADDDKLVGQGLSILLRSAGYRVSYVESAAEAFFRIFDNPSPGDEEYVDLLILDIYFPHMGGLELIEQLEDVQIDVPIIAITGFATKELEKELTGKCKWFIEKPFAHTDILSKVEKILGGNPKKEAVLK